MKVSIEEKWAEALWGKTEAYRKLGVYYLRRSGRRITMRKKKRRINRKLAYLCLDYAAQMGDAEAFYLLNHYFNKGKKVIDDEVYRQMAREYMQTHDPELKKHLQYYLKLGTKCQMKFISGQVPACRQEQGADPPDPGRKKESDTAFAHR